MFIGREKETAEIRDFLKKDSGSMMIYGKRKVGKTTLITSVSKIHLKRMLTDW